MRIIVAKVRKNAECGMQNVELFEKNSLSRNCLLNFYYICKSK